MGPNSITVVNWNIEWRRRSNRNGAELHSRIVSLEPDICCITEGHTDFLDGVYHSIFSHADYGYPIKPDRRKVALWSRNPWREINMVGSDDMPPGRFVSGVTDTSFGPVRCVGICIPWSHAHVTTGRKDAKAWEEHLRYLEGLARYLREVDARKLIILGDFNQMIPRARAPKRVYERLMVAIPSGTEVLSSGAIPEINRQAVDHIVVSSDLRGSTPIGLSNVTENGKRLSDHFGIATSLFADR